MRFGGVFILLAVLVSPLKAQEFLLTKCTRATLLAELRSRQFEQSMPLDPSSLAARYPEIYRKVMVLFNQFPGWEVAFPEGLLRGTPYVEAIEKQVKVQRQIASVLRGLILDLFTEDDDMVGFLEGAAQLFEVDKPAQNASWIRHLHHAKLQRMIGSVRNARIESLNGDFNRYNKYEEFCASIRSAWGEVRAGMMIPNLLANNTLVERLKDLTSLFPTFAYGEKRDVRHTNVDLFWAKKDRLTTLYFGEVKTYKAVLSNNNGNYLRWNDLLEHLKWMQKIADMSYAAESKVVVVLINGIMRPAYEELTAMGYEVMGPVIDLPVAPPLHDGADSPQSFSVH